MHLLKNFSYATLALLPIVAGPASAAYEHRVAVPKLVITTATPPASPGATTPTPPPLASPALSAQALDFGSIPVDESSTAQTVQLTNPNSASITVGTPSTTGPFVATHSCGTVIAAGGTCLISTIFSPTNTGSQSGVLSLATSAGIVQATLAGSGTSTLSELALSPSPSYNFGTHDVGSYSVQTFTLKNTGGVPRALSFGPVTAPFGLSTTCGASLSPGASCTATASFQPTLYVASSQAIPLSWGRLGETTPLQLTGTGGDAYASNTGALLHLDGADGATTFVDQVGNPLTRLGGATLSTAQSKFGGSALYLTGARGDGVQEDGTRFAFSSGDFTVEMWYYPLALNRVSTLFRGDSGTGNGNGLDINHDASVLKFGINGSSTVVASTPTTSLTANAWNHLAFVRHGNQWTIYINGSAKAVGAYASTLLTPLYYKIGANSYSQAYSAYGYLDEFRVTKGVARYTANFTPVQSAFPNP